MAFQQRAPFWLVRFPQAELSVSTTSKFAAMDKFSKCFAYSELARLWQSSKFSLQKTKWMGLINYGAGAVNIENVRSTQNILFSCATNLFWVAYIPKDVAAALEEF